MLSLYGIIYVHDLVYQTPTKSYHSGSFRYTRSRDYQSPTRHALLGSGSCWKMGLLFCVSCDVIHMRTFRLCL